MRAIVTGGSLGLGFETSLALAELGHQVILTSRSEARGLKAIAEIQTKHPNAEVSFLELDLARAQSVDSFSNRFASLDQTWDVLILNAGAKILPRFNNTDFGVEYHFGVNAVSHFAITADLMRHRSDAARVVSVSSIIARIAKPRLGPQGLQQRYNPGESYAASKLSNLLFAIELDRRSSNQGITSVAAHPGFARAEPYGTIFTTWAEGLMAQSARSGSRPIIRAALSKDLAGGSYLGPKVFELWGRPSNATVPKFLNQQMLEENWRILTELSGRSIP